ncbi:AAA family ATPase [Pseudofrankia sp. DC12]|uniref:AAA family ATPase n=1 Tax=Pseudofrankia sp. DC12 TaxID=683315 RepID=UPI000B0AA2C9|nr:AAA family ATPase [Pseudofrankia sp. DC12]
MDSGAQPVPFLRRVHIRGFRSVRDAEVTFGPLTVLLGLNGAGKSNLLDGVRFVRDALASTPGHAVVDRQGPAVVLHRGESPAGPRRLSLELDLDVRAPRTPGEPEPEGLSASYAFQLRLDEGAATGTVIEHERCTVTSTETGVSTGYQVHDGRVVEGPDHLMGPITDATTLFLPAAARWPPFAPVHTALRGMAFQTLDTAAMRPARLLLRSGQPVLDPAGERIAEVLDRLTSRYPLAKRRVDDYLGAILPGALGIDALTVDDYQTLRLRMADPDAEHGMRSFSAAAMSDGTLAAAGLLTALFQPATWTGAVPLVAVEDPELGLHAAAIGALFDALIEASDHVQVIVATQSADLLDREDFPLDATRIVTADKGATIVTMVDDTIRQVVHRRLASLGELQRSNQLTPWPDGTDPGRTP